MYLQGTFNCNKSHQNNIHKKDYNINTNLKYLNYYDTKFLETNSS